MSEPVGSPAVAAAAPREPVASLAAGTWVGRYELLGTLGVGGMGVVYRARDSQLGREVALKLVASAGAAEAETQGRNRLLREAQALAQLSHPNVIAVFDVGRYDEGVFIAMERVTGIQLDEWLAPGRAWPELLRVFTQVGQGLAAAHAVGLVHRDVKPANIMIGDDGRVRVLDFGLARTSAADAGFAVAAASSAARAERSRDDVPTAHGGRGAESTITSSLSAGALTTSAVVPSSASSEAVPSSSEVVPSSSEVVPSSSEAAPSSSSLESAAAVTGRASPTSTTSSISRSLLDTALTLAGAVVGTPPYMAPEQHRGEPCDARSDQFSFCVTFYAALYGERPFAGSSYDELRSNIVDGRVLPPPAGTSVPPWIRQIVLRGLAVDPSARWPSMAALLAALARDPALRRARVVRALAAATVALVAAAVVGRAVQHRASAGICHDPSARLAGVWDGARRDDVAAAFRKTGAGYAEQAFRSVAAVFDDYAASWTGMVADTCRATPARGPQSDELFDLRMACLQNRLRDWKARIDVLGHADRATVEHALAAAQSLERLEVCADPVALRAAVPLPVDPAARARLEALRGRIAAARATIEAGHFADARRLMPALVTDAHAAGYRPVEAEALWAQAELDERTDRYSDAARELKEMTVVAESVRGDELAALGWIDQVWIIGTRLGRLAEGRELARSASAAIERLGENPALRARLEAHLGSLALNDGHTGEARGHVERALALRRRVLRRDDPLLAETLRVLGDVDVMESKADDAIAHYRAALAQLEQTLGPEHPTTGWVTSSLAAALRVKGQLPEALAAYDRARAIVLRNSDASDALLATIALNVGMIDTELGRYDAARAQYAQASTIWTAALGADHPNVGSVHLLVGQLALRRHRLDEARPELARALEIFSKAFGAEHPSVAEALIGFGDLNLAANAPREALTMYRRAATIQKQALGASYPDLAIPLTGMGLAELAQGDAAHARVALEQALALRQATPGDPVERARTAFALARALRAAHGDPARARALAQSARSDYAGRTGQEAALAEVDSFLR